MKLTSTHILIGIAIIGVALIGANKYFQDKKAEVAEGTYTEFAQCIKNSGAQFFGAFWCPHCQEQKALFDDAASELPYVECSTADKQDQTQVCKDAGITGYPTWKFADGKVLNGLVQLQELSSATGCTLPQ
jgi:thiol-disulfide isomerase/thioredoxin